jgi:rhamnogalacturonyl hydrolase YesR
MIAIAAAWDATGDARYRDAAAGYADAAVVVHEPTPAFGDWKMGILADGLASVHAITHDARLHDWLVRYADALVAAPDRFPDPRYALPLGYLWRTDGHARYREVGLATVARMPIGDWGKTLAISGRTGFRILGALGPSATPDRGAPPRPSADAPRPPSPSRAAPAPHTGH